MVIDKEYVDEVKVVFVEEGFEVESSFFKFVVDVIEELIQVFGKMVIDVVEDVVGI